MSSRAQAFGCITAACAGDSNHRQEHSSHLSERLIQLSKDALLVKHLALVTVLVVVVDSLPHICWQLVEGHVLLHLFVLQGHTTIRLLKGHSAVAQIHSHREQLAPRSDTQGNGDGYIKAILALKGNTQQDRAFPVFGHTSYSLCLLKDKKQCDIIY